jgi:hypothetical protein
MTGGYIKQKNRRQRVPGTVSERAWRVVLAKSPDLSACRAEGVGVAGCRNPNLHLAPLKIEIVGSQIILAGDSRQLDFHIEGTVAVGIDFHGGGRCIESCFSGSFSGKRN